jgi:glutathione S-transferase
MAELILHHYAASPFSEKIRKIFALKKLAWRGVDQPMMNPKPKLVPLTGGYRKIPVLQLGADVYCDTAVIVRIVEALHPQPSCFAGKGQGANEIIAHWADHWLFLAVVPPTIVDILPMLPPEFLADRQAMSPGFTVDNLKANLPHSRSQLLTGLDWLDLQLRGRSFLLGDEFSLADAACFHVLWFLRSSAESFAAVENRPALRSWFRRVDEMGQGNMTPLEPDLALSIARESVPDTPERSDGSDPDGIQPGERITVRADDYGLDPITGTAVVVTTQEIALRRQDPQVGEVVVHFPRTGFRLSRA